MILRDEKRGRMFPCCSYGADNILTSTRPIAQPTVTRLRTEAASIGHRARHQALATAPSTKNAPSTTPRLPKSIVTRSWRAPCPKHQGHATKHQTPGHGCQNQQTADGTEHWVSCMHQAISWAPRTEHRAANTRPRASKQSHRTALGTGHWAQPWSTEHRALDTTHRALRNDHRALGHGCQHQRSLDRTGR